MKKFFVLMICLMIFTPYYVFGLENYNTTFNVTISELGYMQQIFGDTQKTYKEVYDEIKSVTTNNYYMIMNNIRRQDIDNKPTNITILITDNYPLMSVVPHFMSNRQYSEFRYLADNNSITYKYKQFTSSDYTQTSIDEIKSCISDYNNCNWSTITNLNSYELPDDYSNITNNSNNNITIPVISPTTRTTYNFPIYANFRLSMGTPTQTQIEATTIYIKNIIVNNITITEGMSVPTYYDLYYPSTPEPEPEPEPEDPENDSEFTSWIYWFSEPTDSTSVLNNIYTLLFLYCFTMIIFKVYYLIKPRK